MNRSTLFLARKFLSGKNRKLISGGHLLSVIGIALGVFALIAVSSVMNGFARDMQSRIIGTQSEIRISRMDYKPVSDYPKLLEKVADSGFSVAPVIRQDLILKKGKVMVPTTGFGIDLEAQKRVSKNLIPYTIPEKSSGDGSIDQGLIAGSSSSDEIFRADGIILGAGLAQQLSINLFENILLMSPMFTQPTAFGLTPRVRTVRVIGIFRAGMPEYDMLYSYIPLGLAQYLAGYGDEIDYLEIKTPDFKRAKHYAQQLRAVFPDMTVADWSSFDPSLYSAIRFEKYIMFIIMMFMYIIASFNLTGNMLKTIAQRKRDLGLLKAIGYREHDLTRLFIYKALILCVIGISGGLLLSILLLGAQIQWGLIRLTVSSSTAIVLPVFVRWLDVAVVVILSFSITLLSAVLPLKRLKSIKAIDLIRQNA